MPKTDLELMPPIPIKLTQRQREYYHAVGGGNISRGIRGEADRAMAQYQARPDNPDYPSIDDIVECVRRALCGNK